MSSSLLGLNTHARDPVTTEWDDIQRKLGNLPPLEEPAPSAAEEKLAEAVRVAEQYGRSEAAAADDEPSGEAAELAQLRAKRLEELKRSGRFGSLIAITHAQFVSEVNHAEEGVGVVVFLFKKGHYASAYMQTLLEKLAAKFRDVKFVTIGHTDCIKDYPDRNLPTLLIYRNDDLLRQCVGTAAFGGDAYGIDDVEWELADAGLVRTEIERNPHAQPHR